jgi:hypothetical protein
MNTISIKDQKIIKEKGLCPYCKDVLYVSDAIKNLTIFECMGDNRIFKIFDVPQKTIDKCNNAHN